MFKALLKAYGPFCNEQPPLAGGYCLLGEALPTLALLSGGCGNELVTLLSNLCFAFPPMVDRHFVVFNIAIFIFLADNILNLDSCYAAPNSAKIIA
jgi:hypothetical protein